MKNINRNIPTPLYYQLQQILLEQIESGVWKPGDTIPTEKELGEQYNISRSVVRQAILSLVNDGYVRREKSRGTIVTSPIARMHFVGSLLGFSKEMDIKGVAHSSRVLNQKITQADDEIASKLQIQVGDPIYYLNRVRYIRDEPYLVDEHFIPYSLCPGIEKQYSENTSLYRLLQTEYHMDLHHGQINFEPIMPPSKEIIDLLEIYSTTTLLYVDRIVLSANNIPMDYFKAIIHGKFSVDVVSTT